MKEDKNTNWIKGLFDFDSIFKKKNKGQLFLLFFLTGLLIVIIGSYFDVTEQVIPYETIENSATQTNGIIGDNSIPNSMQDYEKIFENQLTDVLTEMLGLDEVIVKVNLDSTEEIVVETNVKYSEQITKERDNQGGTREINDISKDEQVVLYNGKDEELPLITKTLKPEVRGVVVVAEGAENLQIKAMIIEAVQKLLDVPPHKIAILPKKN